MESKNQYSEFNNFQTIFFTDINKFQSMSNFEIKKFGYILVNNIAKGFPALANIVTNLKGLNWTGLQSPAILKALQYKLVNRFSNGRIPNYIYFKNNKAEKSTEKARKTKNGKLEFSDDIKKQICEILMYDSKTYDDLKFSDKVQELGKQLLGEFVQTEKLRKKRKSQSDTKLIK